MVEVAIGVVTIGVVLGLSIVVPVIIAERRYRQKRDEKGDFIDDATDAGPTDGILQAIDQQSKELHETKNNILKLGPREIFALLGMNYNGRLSIDDVEHKMGHPVVTVWVKERLYQFDMLFGGWHYTHARHRYTIEIQELDELLGEPVIAVNYDRETLNATGISAYEVREYEDSYGDTVRTVYEREWVDDDSALNRHDVKYEIKEKQIRECNGGFGISESVMLDE
jgi:hypothetical protein